MEIALAPAVQWAAFGLFAFVAIAGALGMTTTMSMFRSGIFLMASFIGVAGLFVLLLADLLGLLQVMMYIGGMLVMILFMLLFSGDPGGDEMASHMELAGPERWFSLGLAHHAGGEEEEEEGGDGEEHEEGGHDEHGGGDGDEEHGGHGGGGHGDMSMFTEVKRPAAWLGAAASVVLGALLLLRPSWPTVPEGTLPDQDSARRIGELLMNDYMIGFEGAGLLILLGIFSAVMVSRPGRHPDPTDRERIRAAVDEHPAPIADEPLPPLHRSRPAVSPDGGGDRAVPGAETAGEEEPP